MIYGYSFAAVDARIIKFRPFIVNICLGRAVSGVLVRMLTFSLELSSALFNYLSIFF